MSQLAIWQRIAYFAGELLLIGGALWGLWARFFGGMCPSGMIGWWSPFALVFIGLGLANLGLHPLGHAPHLLGVFQRLRWLSITLWALGLAGLGYALYVWQGFAGRDWWMLALVPAVIYQLFAVQPRADTRLQPAAVAPPAPPRPGGADGPFGGAGAPIGGTGANARGTLSRGEAMPRPKGGRLSLAASSCLSAELTAAGDDRPPPRVGAGQNRRGRCDCQQPAGIGSHRCTASSSSCPIYRVRSCLSSAGRPRWSSTPTTWPLCWITWRSNAPSSPG